MICFFETSISAYKTTQCYSVEDHSDVDVRCNEIWREVS